MMIIMIKKILNKKYPEKNKEKRKFKKVKYLFNKYLLYIILIFNKKTNKNSIKSI